MLCVRQLRAPQPPSAAVPRPSGPTPPRPIRSGSPRRSRHSGEPKRGTPSVSGRSGDPMLPVQRLAEPPAMTTAHGMSWAEAAGNDDAPLADSPDPFIGTSSSLDFGGRRSLALVSLKLDMSTRPPDGQGSRKR